MKLPKQQCKSCPFLRDGLRLNPERMAEVYSSLLKGQNHLCHSDRTHQTVCLGGRKWILETWYRMGRISEPTNKGLAEAMQNYGVEPASHITEISKKAHWL